MECEHCHNAVQILAYAKTKRVPVYQMTFFFFFFPMSKNGDAGGLDDLLLVLPKL